MFYVGQKVVRVKEPNAADLRHAMATGIKIPPLGEVCTVVAVFTIWNGNPHIELREFPAPESGECAAGWRADGFRPVVERKTSIEIFQRMLTPTKRVKEKQS